jgi:hypothetical protein
MTALSADKIRAQRGAQTEERAAIGTASTIYVGSLAFRRTTTGRIFAATAATGRRVAGVCVRLDGPNGPGTGSGVGNTSGTQYAVFAYGGEWEMTIKTAIRTNTSLGLNVFAADDDVVAGTAVGTAGKRIVVGELIAWSSTTSTTDKSKGWVAIRSFATTNIAV